MPPRILLVEDEIEIAAFIEKALLCEGYRVEVARDGMGGLLSAQRELPDLIILDRMLPQLDGMEICRRIRQSSDVPILMLTAMGEVEDRVAGLDQGADDYLAKPFVLKELLARIRAQLRSRQSPDKTGLAFANMVVDLQQRTLQRGNRAIDLTPKEFDLLSYLMRHPRQVLTRGQIIEAVWGWDFEGEDNVLDVYIRYLRIKLEQEGEPRLIHTIHGVGYVLRDRP